jgi:hypothetical protein
VSDRLAWTVMAWTADGPTLPNVWSRRLSPGVNVRQQGMGGQSCSRFRCAAVAVSLLAIRAADGERPRSAGAAATPATRSAPAQHPAEGTCRQIPLPVPPDRLALVGPHLLVASS